MEADVHLCCLGCVWKVEVKQLVHVQGGQKGTTMQQEFEICGLAGKEPPNRNNFCLFGTGLGRFRWAKGMYIYADILYEVEWKILIQIKFGQIKLIVE